jgi:hypothetical protein
MHVRPEHWLWRLDAPAWLAAAERELALGREHVRSRRRAVTHARRAAGMALNAVLVAWRDRGEAEERCETRWGRSYLDHLRRLADGEVDPLGPDAAATAARLLAIGVVDGDLVQLGRGPDGAADGALVQATALADAARAFLAAD